MAYFKDRLVFETYEVKDGRILCESSALLENELPEEGHFFNETVEYRFVVRKSRKDVIELLLTEDEEKKMDPDLLFYDEGIVREEFSAKEGMPRRLRVINRYRYSENDTLVLNNYRLSM
ncbi:MAG: hypothetical protein K6G42_07595 [Lachnospiraceae bacterium]|nr:hypothetical protein [Lachnospiraceae bacterium]